VLQLESTWRGERVRRELRVSSEAVRPLPTTPIAIVPGSLEPASDLKCSM
jgi:hypothetical protein